jgi:hypothetical protein
LSKTRSISPDGLRFNLEAKIPCRYRERTGEARLECCCGRERECYDRCCWTRGAGAKEGLPVALELASRAVRSSVDADGAGPPEDVLHGFEAGADDYLPKPFELQILLARLRSLQRRREWTHRDWGEAAATASRPLIILANLKQATGAGAAQDQRMRLLFRRKGY